MDKIPIIRQILCYSIPQNRPKKLFELALVTSTWMETVSHFHAPEIILPKCVADTAERMPLCKLVKLMSERFPSSFSSSSSSPQDNNDENYLLPVYLSFFQAFNIIAQKYTLESIGHEKNTFTKWPQFNFITTLEELEFGRDLPKSALRYAIKHNKVDLVRLLVKDIKCLQISEQVRIAFCKLADDYKKDEDSDEKCADLEFQKYAGDISFARQNALLACADEPASSLEILKIIMEDGKASVFELVPRRERPGLHMFCFRFDPIQHFCKVYCSYAKNIAILSHRRKFKKNASAGTKRDGGGGVDVESTISRETKAAELLLSKIEYLMLEHGGRTDNDVQETSSGGKFRGSLALERVISSMGEIHGELFMRREGRTMKQIQQQQHKFPRQEDCDDDAEEQEGPSNPELYGLCFKLLHFILETEKKRRIEHQDDFVNYNYFSSDKNKDDKNENQQSNTTKRNTKYNRFFTSSLLHHDEYFASDLRLIACDLGITRYVFRHLREFVDWVNENVDSSSSFTRKDVILDIIRKRKEKELMAPYLNMKIFQNNVDIVASLAEQFCDISRQDSIYISEPSKEVLAFLKQQQQQQNRVR